MTAAHYSRLTGNLRRASTPVLCSPHVSFLESYMREGRDLLEPPRFEQTDYYRNAAECIDLTGFYFEARKPGDVRLVAERFLDRFDGRAPRLQSSASARVGESPPKSPVLVHRVHSSDCLQLLDGAHRVAIAHARGQQSIRVAVLPGRVRTPMQDLLTDVLWLKGRPELYQPVDFPEVRHWTPVRRCHDRLGRMQSFLRDLDLSSAQGTSYLDIASSYGWFVAHMKALGYRATGVERDPVAVAVGQHAYGLTPHDVRRADCVGFLGARSEPADITSCFSLLHHFVLGRAGVSAEELLHLIDRNTRRVLFVDMGQSHEKWFARSLADWTPDYIDRWLRSKTTFSQVHRLGTDVDGVAPYDGNFGRTLFACVR